MEQLLYKTKSGGSLQDKPRVYFTCHPDDFDRTFNKVCEDIFKTHDCAIYYTANMTELLPEDTREFDLERMNLFVVPVTSKLMSTPNRANDFDLKFAKEKNILILPIMFETGLDAIYSRPENFGNRQYLAPFEHDMTAISYEEKLKKYLENTLFDDKTVERIRKAFDAYIFLSYRKMDRVYANDLMKLIHSVPKFRDLAIWYDEFLTPGEAFDREIEKALSLSKLFAMAVTPNLVKYTPDGKPNYVITEEYPKARNTILDPITGKKIPILPLQVTDMDENDLKALKDEFPEIPKSVDGRNLPALSEAMYENLKQIALQENNTDPEHIFLIGLAYQNGIDVELNPERALSLIISAAEAGHLEAVERLTWMYYYGFYIERNIDEARYWQKKKIAILRQLVENGSDNKIKYDLVDSLRFLCEIASQGIEDKNGILEAINICKESLTLCNSVEFSSDEETSRFINSRLYTVRQLAILNEEIEEYDSALFFYCYALELREQVTELDRELNLDSVNESNQFRIAQLHHDIGILHIKKKDYADSVKELEISTKLFEELLQKTNEYLPEMSNAYRDLSTAYEYIDWEKAEKTSLRYFDLCNDLFHSDSDRYELIYATALLERACKLTQKQDRSTNDDEQAEKMLNEAVMIFKKHRNDGFYQSFFDHCVALYKLANIYSRKLDCNLAENAFQSCIAMTPDILKVDTEQAISQVADVYYDFAVFSMMNPNNPDYSLCEEYIAKSEELFSKLNLKYPHSRYQRSIQDISSVRKAMDSAQSDGIYPKEIYQQRKDLLQSSTSSMKSKQKIFALLEDFNYAFGKGEKEEEDHNYKAAYHDYLQSADILKEIEKLSEAVGRLEWAELFDRIAVCAEMLGEKDQAVDYYQKAIIYSTLESQTTDDVEPKRFAAAYLKKLAGFFDDQKEQQKAHHYYELLVEMCQQIIEVEPSIESMNDFADALYLQFTTSDDRNDKSPLNICIDIWKRLSKIDSEHKNVYRQKICFAKILSKKRG